MSWYPFNRDIVFFMYDHKTTMFSSEVLKLCLILNILTTFAQANIDKEAIFLGNKDHEKELADFILAKGYLPKEDVMPKSAVTKKEVNDENYLLSKLSDEELVKLLKAYPKKTEYNLSDLVNITGSPNDLQQPDEKPNKLRSRFRTVTSDAKAYFKLDEKPVYTDNIKSKDPQEEAMLKLKNILYSRPVDQNLEDDKKKEVLFDILVSQLKSLCCKKPPKPKYLEPLLTDFTNKRPSSNLNSAQGPTNYMFLIINDDIPVNLSDKDGLISVDPESLDEKSSVLLLGPIVQHLTNIQLKLVMNRITKELSRAEYIPLLQQIADGKLDQENIRLMKSLVTGPDTRRFIKPHRCNYQARLSNIYGGPRWIICTGYLNLNQPSLYD